MQDDKIPVEWIRDKYIRSRRYTGTITETGAKVILRDWEAYCLDLYRKEYRKEHKKDDR